MTLIKRAEPQLEQRVLRLAKKYFTDTSNLKVYLLVSRDGSFIKNPNGNVGMQVLTDKEVANGIKTGEMAFAKNIAH
ncbi:hypothetical protein AAA420_11435 [Lactobacillus crispatus]|uniref:hypothetical protein n=1 Tax=Lactobacillus crispatus TaxID=47770 RepID=UPI0021BDDC93|nr:hypothetical protein [Lactobacillus crispatus]